MVRNREDAARQLARRLKSRKLRDPVVLGIPRGGVVIAAVLARELDAELDIVLSRKLRAPYQPELAIGAIGEGGEPQLQPFAQDIPGVTEQYVREESARQRAEIARRRTLFRAVKAPADVKGRSVIVTDDGIATGSTMLAALHVLNAQGPHEVILAVPVAPPDALDRFRPQCGHIECLLAPAYFGAVGNFYDDFTQVEDAEVVGLLRERHAARSMRLPSGDPVT
jgi:predicted phosphoribosyltransferase